MNMKKSRDPFWDAAKGVAIVLVAFGHAIQYGSGRDFLWGSLYFNQRVFQFIYSFHMPLFMLISGYFFDKTFSCNTLRHFTHETLYYYHQLQ